MAKTSSVFARVDTHIKEQAEAVLDRLGISMSNAVDIFFRQVIIHQGLPFEVKLKKNPPQDILPIAKNHGNPKE